MQVLLRLQWERQLVRGRSMHIDASLDGLGISVMGGLQDELFNLTMDRIQVLSCVTDCHACLMLRDMPEAGKTGLLE